MCSLSLSLSLSLSRSLSLSQPFDDEPYSVVRKGPFYSPTHKSTSESPQLYDTTSSPPPAKPPRDVARDSRESFGASAGLSELDNLLAMLNDTQQTIQKGWYHTTFW